MDNLSERGLDPTVCQLFIIDGAKALSKVVHRTWRPPANPTLSDSQGAQCD